VVGIARTVIPGNASLSQRLIREMMQTVDLAYAEEGNSTMGSMVPLNFLTPPIRPSGVPLTSTVRGPPLAPLHRAWALGEALRRAADLVPDASRWSAPAAFRIGRRPRTPGRSTKAGPEFLRRWQAKRQAGAAVYSDEATTAMPVREVSRSRTFISIAAARRGGEACGITGRYPSFRSAAHRHHGKSHVAPDTGVQRKFARRRPLRRALPAARAILAALRVDGAAVFPPGGVRVRAIACEDYCIADGTAGDAAFVHAILKIGAGRSDAASKPTCSRAVRHHEGAFCGAIFRQGLALVPRALRIQRGRHPQHNNLHARSRRTREP